MSVTKIKVGVGLSMLSNPAVISGYVNGDETTITSVEYEDTSNGGDITSLFEGEFPETMTIDGKQYKWLTFMNYKTDALTGSKTEYIQKAVLNIGNKIIVNKPFFEVDAQKNSNPRMVSFYDLGCLVEFENEGYKAVDFEINGNTDVPIKIENSDLIKLSDDAIYRFTWQIGTKTYKENKKANGANKIEASYKIPKMWCEEVTNATEKKCILKVEAIFGTQTYQSLTQTVKATVPADCVPQINKVSIADTMQRVPTTWGMFVQHNSNVCVAAIDYTESYGAKVTSVTMNVNDKKYDGKPTKLPSTEILKEYGIMDISVTIRDTRGRTATQSAKITVVEYNPPTLQVNSMRCGQSGSIENEGVYFLASTDSTYSPCNGKNEVSLQVQYKKSGDTEYNTLKGLPLGDVSTVCGGDLDVEFTYDVRYILKDTFNTVTVIDFVSTAVYLMHFLHGGRGVAFGSKATVENAVDFAFDAIFRGDVQFIKPDGSAVTIKQILDKIGL